MSRQSAIIPVAFANAPAPPSSEPTVNLDTDFNYVLGLIQDSSNGFVNSAADTGTSNNYVVNLPATITPSGYTNGMTVAFLVLNTNTGASIINVNGLGSVPILTTTGNVLSQGYLVQSNIAMLVYYSGNFYLITTPPSLVLNQDLGILSSTTTTINCSGYNFVNVAMQYNGPSAFTLTLNNLGVGTVINWIYRNTSGNNRVFEMAATLAPLSTGITNIHGLGYYNPGSGFSQFIDLTNGTANLIPTGTYGLFNATVSTISNIPLIIGSVAGGT